MLDRCFNVWPITFCITNSIMLWCFSLSKWKFAKVKNYANHFRIFRLICGRTEMKSHIRSIMLSIIIFIRFYTIKCVYCKSRYVIWSMRFVLYHYILSIFIREAWWRTDYVNKLIGKPLFTSCNSYKKSEISSS